MPFAKDKNMIQALIYWAVHWEVGLKWMIRRRW